MMLTRYFILALLLCSFDQTISETDKEKIASGLILLSAGDYPSHENISFFHPDKRKFSFEISNSDELYESTLSRVTSKCSYFLYYGQLTGREKFRKGGGHLLDLDGIFLELIKVGSLRPATDLEVTYFKETKAKTFGNPDNVNFVCSGNMKRR